MSIQSVRQEIKSAMTPQGCAGAGISTAEMNKINATAEADGVVSPGEARQIDQLVKEGIVRSPGQAMTKACPEYAGSSFTIDKAAVKSANAMFARNALPYGKNEAVIRDKIADAIFEGDGYGKKLSKGPSTRGFHKVEIKDQRPVDGPLTEAFIDAKKDVVYIKSTPSGFGGNTTPTWYKTDIKLKTDAPSVSDKTIAKMRAALTCALKDGSIEFAPPGSGMPLGVKFERVPLMAQKHPDGYSYSALIPVGVVYPGAKEKDPNKATSFFVERTGGIAGWTQIGGPISV